MHWFPGYCLARDQSAAVAYMMNTAVVWLLLVQFFWKTLERLINLSNKQFQLLDVKR